MGKIHILNPDVGINTQDDPEDTGKLLACQNFETDKKGEIYKRNAKNLVKTYSDTMVTKIDKWAHEKLDYGSEWFMHLLDFGTWTSRVSAANNDWRSVCWSPELTLFAAVSDDGVGNRVMTSPDGITWTIGVSAADNDWTSICWSQELTLFVAVANSGVGNRVMTSPDGITWTIGVSAADSNWYSVCWSASLVLFVAVAYSAAVGEAVMTSPDGIAWTCQAAANDGWRSVCWSPELGLFVTVGISGVDSKRAMSSPDGINWTRRIVPAELYWYSVCWSPELNLFMAVATKGSGTSGAMTSPDGITWTSRTPAADNDWISVCWSPEGGLFVAVSHTGTLDRVMTSHNGINWVIGTTPNNNSWWEVCWSYELGIFAAVSITGTGNRVMTSPIDEYIKRSDTAFLSTDTVKTFSNGYIDSVQIIPFDREIRFANGRMRASGVFQYIDLKYFWNEDIKTVASFDYDNGPPREDEIAWTPSITSETGSGGTLDLSTTDYYYRVALEYDGNQVALLQTDNYRITSGLANSTVLIDLSTWVANWQERITGLKFYRSTAWNGPYRSILNVSCLDNNDTKLDYQTDANVGRALYDPDASFSSLNGKNLVVGDGSGEITSTDTNILVVDTNIDVNSTIWGDNYSIWDAGTIRMADGFEDNDITDWVAVGTIAEAVDSTTVRSGTYSMKITTNHGGNVTKTITTTNLETIYVEVWVYVDANAVELYLDGNLVDTSLGTASWEKLEGSRAAAGVTMTVKTQANGNTVWYQDDCVASEDGALDSAGTNGHAGRDVIISDSWGFGEDSHQNYRVLVGTAANGNNDTNSEIRRVTYNVTKALQVDAVFTGSYLGVDLRSYLSQYYLWQLTATGVVTLKLYDPGMLETGYHPLEGVKAIGTQYEHGVYLNGRLYVLNIRIDPSDTAIDYKDAIGFSEEGQPDVIPQSNLIFVKDLQGGEIMNGAEISGDLAIFMERGIFRLNIPTDNPRNWRLMESKPNIGCVASDSVEDAEGIKFFAGYDNIYAITPDFRDFTIGDDIKDDYQGQSNLDQSVFKYDNLKGRLLCRFGNDVNTTYCFDVKYWITTGRKKWTTMEHGSGYECMLFAINNDLTAYSLNHQSDTSIYDLYDTNGTSESYSVIWETGWLYVSQLEDRGIARRLNIVYNSEEAITIEIYTDKESDVKKSIALPANDSSGKKFKSYRIGQRGNYVKVKVYTAAATKGTVEMSRLDLTSDE